MHIRPATEEDCDAIAAIWNPIIRDSQATFNSQPKTPAAIMADIQAKHTDGAAFLVAVQGADFWALPHTASFAPQTAIVTRWNTRSFWLRKASVAASVKS
jgi:L-amino acid N-acyltransferase YncA